MSAAGRCAVRDKTKKAASPLTYEWLPRSRRGTRRARVRGRPSGLKAAAHRLPAAAPSGPALTPETTAAPRAGKNGQALACPARGAARPVPPYPAHKPTPGIEDELAFDTQKRNRNYKNPLTGSVHASRGLPMVFRDALVGHVGVTLGGHDW